MSEILPVQVTPTQAGIPVQAIQQAPTVQAIQIQAEMQEQAIRVPAAIHRAPDVTIPHQGTPQETDLEIWMITIRI